MALNLVREQRRLGVDAKIWCLDSPEEIEWCSASSGVEAEHIVGFPSKGPGYLGYSPAMERAAVELGERVDVIHQHSIWSMVSRVTNTWRRRFHRPTVVAPHGTLETWCLARSKLSTRRLRVTEPAFRELPAGMLRGRAPVFP